MCTSQSFPRSAIRKTKAPGVQPPYIFFYCQTVVLVIRTSEEETVIMFSQILLLLTTLVSLAITSPQGIQSILRTQDSECTSDIHMIVVRATTEAQGYGALGKIVNETCEQLPGATSEAIDYPANGLNSFTEYAESETTGIENTTKAIQAYAQRCPESRIALLGYSQVRFLKPPTKFDALFFWADRPIIGCASHWRCSMW